MTPEERARDAAIESCKVWETDFRVWFDTVQERTGMTLDQAMAWYLIARVTGLETAYQELVAIQRKWYEKQGPKVDRMVELVEREAGADEPWREPGPGGLY